MVDVTPLARASGTGVARLVARVFFPGIAGSHFVFGRRYVYGSRVYDGCGIDMERVMALGCLCFIGSLGSWEASRLRLARADRMTLRCRLAHENRRTSGRRLTGSDWHRLGRWLALVVRTAWLSWLARRDRMTLAVQLASKPRVSLLTRLASRTRKTSSTRLASPAWSDVARTARVSA